MRLKHLPPETSLQLVFGGMLLFGLIFVVTVLEIAFPSTATALTAPRPSTEAVVFTFPAYHMACGVIPGVSISCIPYKGQ